MSDFYSEAYELELGKLEAENEKLRREKEELRGMLYDFREGATSARDTLNLTIVKYLESLKDLI